MIVRVPPSSQGLRGCKPRRLRICRYSDLQTRSEQLLLLPRAVTPAERLLNTSCRIRPPGESHCCGCCSVLLSAWLSRLFICAAGMPDAYPPPARAPMLVPAMQSTGTCISSSTSRTPTWAPPLAPPPARTKPTRGRCVEIAVGAAVRSIAVDWARIFEAAKRAENPIRSLRLQGDRPRTPTPDAETPLGRRHHAVIDAVRAVCRKKPRVADRDNSSDRKRGDDRAGG